MHVHVAVLISFFFFFFCVKAILCFGRICRIFTHAFFRVHEEFNISTGGKNLYEQETNPPLSCLSFQKRRFSPCEATTRLFVADAIVHPQDSSALLRTAAE